MLTFLKSYPALGSCSIVFSCSTVFIDEGEDNGDEDDDDEWDD